MRRVCYKLMRMSTFPTGLSLLCILLLSCCASPRRVTASDTHPSGSMEVVAPFPSDRATLELHAHLFMKEGMTWAFSGDFEGPLKAENWKTRFHSEANLETLDRSEIGVVVAALYAHPLFVTNLRESIRRQIALAEKFVAEHPHWVLARNAAQARAAISQGRRVMILSLEGADGIIDNEEDLREFVDQKGISIVTLLHLTDDQYGGVAFLRGIRALASPWAWITQLFNPMFDDGHRINANGLTQKGRAMAEALIKRHVWIDLAHASDLSSKELIEIQVKSGIPLLYTHSPFRKYMQAERGISSWELAQVHKSGGILGVMPSDEMLEGTLIPPERCASGCQLECKGGIQALAVNYADAVEALGAESVGIGSDYNGGIPHLHPSCAVGAGLDAEGLWNIGQQPEIWTSLERMGMPVPSPRRKMVDHFVDVWSRVNPGT
jgi:microsomal dipeptidase-like Zn-dependent dipeptidase